MIRHPSRRLVLAGATAAAGCASLPPSDRTEQIVWTFDRFEDVGGEATAPEGGPRLIDSPWGSATLFDGVDDALFIERHPLAGAQTWTIECLIRPDGGAFEQRFQAIGVVAGLD